MNFNCFFGETYATVLLGGCLSVLFGCNTTVCFYAAQQERGQVQRPDDLGSVSTKRQRHQRWRRSWSGNSLITQHLICTNLNPPPRNVTTFLLLKKIYQVVIQVQLGSECWTLKLRKHTNFQVAHWLIKYCCEFIVTYDIINITTVHVLTWPNVTASYFHCTAVHWEECKYAFKSAIFRWPRESKWAHNIIF